MRRKARTTPLNCGRWQRAAERSCTACTKKRGAGKPWRRVFLAFAGTKRRRLAPIPVVRKKQVAMTGKRGQGARGPHGGPCNDDARKEHGMPCFNKRGGTRLSDALTATPDYWNRLSARLAQQCRLERAVGRLVAQPDFQHRVVVIHVRQCFPDLLAVQLALSAGAGDPVDV